jgi:peptidoglycan hydrolase-like protein with peptidoglycan-binding domain
MRKWFSSVKLVLLTIVVVSLLAAACSSSDSADTTAAASSDSATQSSPIVTELQKALQAMGYHPGTVDGIYGQHTIDAVKEFQTEVGITVDGKYGPQTHQALEEAAAGSDFDWDEFAAVKELQTEMKDLGFYEGVVDGEYGPQTEAGVKAVQAACQINQDGIYGPDTHSCLVDLSGDA